MLYSIYNYINICIFVLYDVPIATIANKKILLLLCFRTEEAGHKHAVHASLTKIILLHFAI